MSKYVSNENNQKRSSNLELFRIITMILIIAHHYVVNSGLMALISENYLSSKSIFLLIFGAWGKTGINCFVLLTGYFMCKSQITMGKLLKLLGEIYFYKIVIFIIFLIGGYEVISINSLFNVFSPIDEISRDFVDCYLMFYLAIPFLNILIKNMNEKQHIYLVILLTFIYVGLGTMPKINVEMNYISWFIVLYFIAAYIRCYPKKWFDNLRIWGILTITFISLSIFSIISCAWISERLERNLSFYFVADSNKLFAVCTAICAFMFFKNIKIKHNKMINGFAASTFGVLLIHANSDAMRQWLWVDTLNNVKMYNSKWLEEHAIMSVLIIYLVCTLIDFLRIQMIEKPFLKKYNKNQV